MKSFFGVVLTAIAILIVSSAEARLFSVFSNDLSPDVAAIVNEALKAEIAEAYSGLESDPHNLEVWRVSLGSKVPDALFVWFQDSLDCGASSNSACPIYILVLKNGKWIKVGNHPFPSRDLAVETQLVNGVHILTNWAPNRSQNDCTHLTWSGAQFSSGTYGHWAYCKGGPR